MWGNLIGLLCSIALFPLSILANQASVAFMGTLGLAYFGALVIEDIQAGKYKKQDKDVHH